MERVKKWRFDILQAIEHISDFMYDVQTFEEYDNDYKTQSAVERQLAIIGEAVNQLRKADTELKLTHADQIVGFRNWLVHAYDSIDNSIIWAILQDHRFKMNLLLGAISKRTRSPVATLAYFIESTANSFPEMVM